MLTFIFSIDTNCIIFGQLQSAVDDLGEFADRGTEIPPPLALQLDIVFDEGDQFLKGQGVVRLRYGQGHLLRS